MVNFFSNIRPLTKLKEYKMRETHVVFMYVAYQAFFYAMEGMDEKIGLDALKAMQYKLTALHLVKGFSAQVTLISSTL
jgi:hypothetical protein